MRDILLTGFTPEPTNPFIEKPTLSAMEKYLLRRGWTLRDASEPFTGRVITVAEHLGRGVRVAYPHPAYHYHGQKREQDLHQALEELAAIEHSTVEALSLAITSIFALPRGDFACKQCGVCCECFRDAYQGRVTYEEVVAWETLGLRRILRFIQVVERRDYRLYKAWVHPRTDEYMMRCPWLSSDRNGKRLCRIHAYRPLKCRSFPLSAAQAERANCPGHTVVEMPQQRPEKPEPQIG